MTVFHLIEASVPLLQQFFPPISLSAQVSQTPIMVQAVLQFCLGVAYLALWRATPDFRAFRTLGIFFALVSLQQMLIYFGGLTPTLSLRALASGVLVESAGDAMRIQHRRWTWFFWPVYLFVFLAIWSPSFAFTHDWPVLVSEIPLAILIVLGFRRGNARDRSIAVAFLFYLVVRLSLTDVVQQLLHIRQYVLIGGWQWYYSTTGLSLLGTVTLAIFARDLIRTREEKQRLAAELEASRAVQQVLIPEEIPTVPGFEIHAVYRPYGEVGGDFFQILPRPDGSVLIAIGDVSGKGMPAAMLVSLLVGALRALTETSVRPAELLAGLNRSVERRSRGGFTTCLILHLTRDGKLTFANAGHIAPYRNGTELPCDNGLPLGIVAEAGYLESSLPLSPGEQLTLVTDGVVEARSNTGQLFGFERTAAISAQSADAIANQAQAFGQDDDITVLTVTGTAVIVSSTV